MACSTGEAWGFTETRSGAARYRNQSAVMMLTIEALDPWCPPTLTPEVLGRVELAWSTIATASHRTRSSTRLSLARSCSVRVCDAVAIGPMIYRTVARSWGRWRTATASHTALTARAMTLLTTSGTESNRQAVDEPEPEAHAEDPDLEGRDPQRGSFLPDALDLEHGRDPHRHPPHRGDRRDQLNRGQRSPPGARAARTWERSPAIPPRMCGGVPRSEAVSRAGRPAPGPRRRGSPRRPPASGTSGRWL